jgi:hypothetical protein
MYRRINAEIVADTQINRGPRAAAALESDSDSDNRCWAEKIRCKII